MSKLKIEVFGSGCAKCRKTYELFVHAASEIGLQADIKHITDINKGVQRGVLFTPAVFIGGKKVAEGKVPSISEVEELLKNYQG